MGKVKRYARKGLTVLKNEGVLSTAIKTLQAVEKRKKQQSDKIADKIQYTSLVARTDAMAADWSNHPYVPVKIGHSAPYVINWVMSPPSGGGGHQNIFRFVEHLDRLGFKNNIYLYSTFDDMTIGQAKENVAAYCQAKNLSFYRYKGQMAPSDIVFATGWETAYPVFNDATNAYKMYFVQDYEPYFYPVGTDYVLAENTYRFGFHGVTAGGFLKHKLSETYGMKCDHFDFGADTKLYQYRNAGARKEVFFYARPVTERRGFDLGVMALEMFHKQLPDYTINLAGWDVSGYDVPFPYVNHKALRLEELSELYNRCSVALVLSLTNLSLLPLELMLCGTIPVVNDGDNNRLVSDNPYIAYTGAAPAALAKKMVEIVQRDDLPAYAAEASASVGSGGWSASLDEFEKIVRGVLA
jgi:O-antigen biosynthesis protein